MRSSVRGMRATLSGPDRADPMAENQRSVSSNTVRLTALRGMHTAIWFSVEAEVFYLVFSGLARRTGRSVDLAAAIVALETAVFVLDGFRCPLTKLARSLGSEEASVTDLFLPGWLARALPALHVPLLVLVTFLYLRNRTRQGDQRP